jgi:hypothetical protein
MADVGRLAQGSRLEMLRLWRNARRQRYPLRLVPELSDVTIVDIFFHAAILWGGWYACRLIDALSERPR